MVPDAALLTEDLLDREVEVETLGGTKPFWWSREASITEVKGRAEPKSEMIAAFAIVVEAPQDAIAAGDSLAMPAEQDLTAVAVVVEPDIEADNGVIHGIDLVLLPLGTLRSF
jgi:Fasciclin domain